MLHPWVFHLKFFWVPLGARCLLCLLHFSPRFTDMNTSQESKKQHFRPNIGHYTTQNKIEPWKGTTTLKGNVTKRVETWREVTLNIDLNRISSIPLVFLHPQKTWRNVTVRGIARLISIKNVSKRDEGYPGVRTFSNFFPFGIPENCSHTLSEQRLFCHGKEKHMGRWGREQQKPCQGKAWWEQRI